MKIFLQIYRWSMQMKLRMALYTFGGTFLNIVCNLLHGEQTVLIHDLLTLWAASLVFAMIESAIFQEGSECTRRRVPLWLGAANLCFLGGAALFQWFEGVPLWGGILLTLFLEMGLGMMWFGDQFVLKMDSAQLTQQLRRYQNAPHN